MTSIPLKILIRGLIALVPTIDPDGTHHMTALLVDGRHSSPPSIDDCMLDHHPQLRFFVKEPADCFAVPGCEATGNQCTCAYNPDNETAEPLERKQINLEILPAPVLATANPGSSLPDHGLPTDSREAGRFSYVANLAKEPFWLAVDPTYLAPIPPPEALSHLIARMEVPYKTLTSCNLAMRPDGGEANIHSMSFRALGDKSDSGEVSYALAQSVIAELMVPDAGEGGQIVKLHISDFGGQNDHALTLLPGSDAYRIELFNEPGAPLAFDHPCDDGVARHFDHYFFLAKVPPEDRLVPHVRATQFKSAAPLQPSACKEPPFGIENRPICPMVTFNP